MFRVTTLRKDGFGVQRISKLNASRCWQNRLGTLPTPEPNPLSLVKMLVKQYEHPDIGLFSGMLDGFPVVDKLPPCSLKADGVPKTKTVKPLSELIDEWQACNGAILSSLGESEEADDLDDIYNKNFELGALGDKQVIEMTGSPMYTSQGNRCERVPSQGLENAGSRRHAGDESQPSDQAN